MSDYLYLLWNDYRKDGGPNPEELLAQKKVEIAARFQALQDMNPNAQEEKALLHDAFSLSNDHYKKALEYTLSGTNTKYGIILTNIDAAANDLKEANKKGATAQQYLKELHDVISSLDEVINIAGIDKKGITDANIKIISNIRKKAISLEKNISKGQKITNNIFEELEKLQGEVASRVSGAALEVFLSLSYMTSYTYGENTINKQVTNSFINTGAKVTHKNLNKNYNKSVKQELKFLEDSSQVKSDTIKYFRMNPEDGSGEGKLTIFYESAQTKNYSSITDIPLGKYSEGTLAHLNNLGDSVYKYFPQVYLVNLGGSLGSNARYGQNTYPRLYGMVKNHKYNNDNSTQEKLAQNWSALVKEVSILTAIDAFAGRGMLNSSKYWVIRHKGSGDVKIISTYDIISKIKNDDSRAKIMKTHGLYYKDENSGKDISIRYQMSDVNKNSFEDKRGNPKVLGQTRSSKAWGKIKNLIDNTKVRIALNASAWFD